MVVLSVVLITVVYISLLYDMEVPSFLPNVVTLFSGIVMRMMMTETWRPAFLRL